MKKFFMFAVTAAMFAACASDDNDNMLSQQKQQADEESAVTFGAYVNRATTRAGQQDEMTTTTLQSSGFGVFAFYTDNADYTQFATPNFMYNQEVKYASGSWTYDPVKYWPNEYGNDAISDDVDKVTFFAYAPYVDVDVSKGAVTDAEKSFNITQISRNSSSGDPIVKYVVNPEPKKGVDLLWGVQPATQTYQPIVNGVFTATPGMPYIDLVKSEVDKKIQFDFKHALAKLNVQIDAVADKTTGPTTTLDATKTRIYVRSITFTGFETKGALNLNNTDANLPLWLTYDCNSELAGKSSEVVVYDGLKDGKEAKSGAEQKNEKPAALNATIIQNECYNGGAFAAAATTGVTETAQNVFKSTTATEPIFVIPTYETMDVTIVYDVETIDPNLPTYLSDGVTHGSSIENKITKNAVFGTTTNIEAGKAYTLKLHLGMTSVNFDASVSEWDGSTSEANQDLPANK